MKKLVFVFTMLIICICSSSYTYAKSNDGEKINEVFRRADELSPGTYKRWEEVRNIRNNLKDEIVQKKREQWKASAEDREAVKETIDLEEEFLLNQYKEGIITEKEYEEKLKVLHLETSQLMIEKNRCWVEEVRRDQEIMDEYKGEMKESFAEIMEGIKDNNKVQVDKSFDRFIYSYEKTTDVLKEKMKGLD